MCMYYYTHYDIFVNDPVAITNFSDNFDYSSSEATVVNHAFEQKGCWRTTNAASKNVLWRRVV